MSFLKNMSRPYACRCSILTQFKAKKSRVRKTTKVYGSWISKTTSLDLNIVLTQLSILSKHQFQSVTQHASYPRIMRTDPLALLTPQYF